MLLPISLCLVAGALLINFWLAWRCGQARSDTKIFIGDGGNELLMRRMRAQANFIEQTPLLLLGVVLVEAAGKGGIWLAPLGGLFLLGRIAHGIGMDGAFKPGRAIGMATGMLLTLALVVTAALIMLGKM
jgi:uncharacterized membrane protein YecN with MAPEG domain